MTGTEIWAPIPSCPGYEASTLGRIRSITRVLHDKRGRARRHQGRVLRQHPLATSAHLQVGVGGHITRRVHRLVLEAFVGPCPEGMEGCHEDGDPTNNQPENLRWDTPSNNEFDRVRHGRHPFAQRTHCPREHPLEAPNLAPRTSWRTCLACARGLAYWRYWQARGVALDEQAVVDRYYQEIMTGVAA